MVQVMMGWVVCLLLGGCSFAPGQLADGAADVAAPAVDTMPADGATSDAAHCPGGPSGWHPLGGPMRAYTDAVTYAFGTSIIIGPSGRPVVSWTENWDSGFVHHRLAHVRRWTGSSWELLGWGMPAAGPGFESYDSQLATGGNALIVAWPETDLSTYRAYLHVRRWNGSSWEPLGDLSTEMPVVFVPPWLAPFGLAVDGAGNPYVAWHSVLVRSARSVIRVFHWTGSAWQAVGGEILSPDAGYSIWADPALTLDDGGQPVVAWSTVEHGVQIRRWDGSAWVAHAGGEVGKLKLDGVARGTRLAPNSGSEPIVGFTRREEGHARAFAAQWQGQGWDPFAWRIAAQPGHQESAWMSDLVQDSRGRKMISWIEDNGSNRRLHLARYEGSTYRYLGAPNASGGAADLTSGDLAVDSCDHLYAAVAEHNMGQPGSKIQVWVYRD